MTDVEVKVRGFALDYDERFVQDSSESLQRVLERGWLSEGPEVRRFEEAFGALCPATHRIATTSCTVALELALRAIGVRGRRVIIPTNTFWATALAVKNAGAEVDLVDVNPETFSISPNALDTKLTAEPTSTAAVIVVHVGGAVSSDISQIQAICARAGVPLIEDAAAAHGASTVDGRHAGCLGVVGCFSFFATKSMTTGEGGMVVTSDDALAGRIRKLKNFGRADGSSADLICEDAEGLNGRVPEVVGLLGALECVRAPQRIERRRQLAGRYASILADEPLYRMLPVEGRSSHYKAVVCLEEGMPRELVRSVCKGRGVELSGEVWARPVHRHPAFEALGAGRMFPGAEKVSAAHICPPLYPELDEGHVQLAAEALLSAAKAYRAQNSLPGALPPPALELGMSRALALTAPRKIEIHEEPLRPPGPGEVRIRVGASGICGSDLHYFRHGGLGTHAARLPLYPGHEVAGTVEAVGHGEVCGLVEGTRVAVEPADSCRSCNVCGRGRWNLCSKGTFLGAEGSARGGLADTLIVSAQQCVPLPDGIGFKAGALLEPLGVGLYACRLAEMRTGVSFGVVGCGAVGLCTLFCSLKEGGVNSWCVDPIKERRELANDYGAGTAVPPGSKGLEKAEVVFDVVGSDASLAFALDHVDMGGRVILIGIPEQDHLQFNPHRARIKGVSIINVRRSNVGLAECLALLDGDKDIELIERMATHSFSFADAMEHFELAATYAHGAIRCMLVPSL